MTTEYEKGYNAGVESERKRFKEVMEKVFEILTRSNFIHKPMWNSAIKEAEEDES